MSEPLLYAPFPLDAQGSVKVQIGEISGDAGGYVQIKNPGSEAVDISGRSLSGAIQYTFPPGDILEYQIYQNCKHELCM